MKGFRCPFCAYPDPLPDYELVRHLMKSHGMSRDKALRLVNLLIQVA